MANRTTPARISPTMLAALRYAADDTGKRTWEIGRLHVGTECNTRDALRARGLTSDGEITDAGRAAVA